MDDRDLQRRHIDLIGLLAELVVQHGRKLDDVMVTLTGGFAAMTNALDDIKTDLTTLESNIDSLIAQKDANEASDLADIKTRIDSISTKVTGALTPNAAAPTPTATDTTVV